MEYFQYYLYKYIYIYFFLESFPTDFLFYFSSYELLIRNTSALERCRKKGWWCKKGWCFFFFSMHSRRKIFFLRYICLIRRIHILFFHMQSLFDLSTSSTSSSSSKKSVEFLFLRINLINYFNYLEKVEFYPILH